MMIAMSVRAGVLALLGLAVAACDPGWLETRGLHVIREVSVGEGARLLEDPEAQLIQVRGPEWTGVRVAGTSLVAARDPLPPELADGAVRIIVLAEELDQGLRMAARLSRAGIQEVAVVRGGVAAWQAAHRPGGMPEASTPSGARG
jgi:rhodanese-related sulfurtransferase